MRFNVNADVTKCFSRNVYVERLRIPKDEKKIQNNYALLMDELNLFGLNKEKRKAESLMLKSITEEELTSIDSDVSYEHTFEFYQNAYNNNLSKKCVEWARYEKEAFEGKSYDQCTEKLVKTFQKKEEKRDAIQWSTSLEDFNFIKHGFSRDPRQVEFYLLQAKNIVLFAKNVNNESEVEILRYIRHPNIMEILKLFHLVPPVTSTEKLLICAPIYPLGNLAMWAYRERSCRRLLTKNFVRYATAQIVMAIDFLDKIKVAHCDIKPHNVCFNIRGYAKLIDFGHAVHLADGCKTRKACGTRGYIPFNIPHSMKTADAFGFYSRKIDIYEFGATFFNLVKGIAYAFDQPKFYELDGEQRIDYFDKLVIDENIDDVGLKKVLNDTLLINFYENKRPSASALMKYEYYKDVDWTELFMQRLDMGKLYRIKIRDWFEVLIKYKRFEGMIDK